VTPTLVTLRHIFLSFFGDVLYVLCVSVIQSESRQSWWTRFWHSSAGWWWWWWCWARWYGCWRCYQRQDVWYQRQRIVHPGISFDIVSCYTTCQASWKFIVDQEVDRRVDTAPEYSYPKIVTNCFNNISDQLQTSDCLTVKKTCVLMVNQSDVWLFSAGGHIFWDSPMAQIWYVILHIRETAIKRFVAIF